MFAQQGAAPPPMDMPGMLMQGFLGTMSVVLLFLTPMLTMALFSEEKKRGTMELLLTSPITDLQIVLGKFFAAVAFFAIMLLSTWIPASVVYIFASPSTAPILTGYLGLLLYGLAVLSIGMFISALTESQVVAAMWTFGVSLALWLVDGFTRNFENPVIKGIFDYMSIISHLDDFLKGILNTTNVIFYLSLTLLGLFLTYRSIDSLRWRG
jgi:ABC-2 type transport system permease protein